MDPTQVEHARRILRSVHEKTVARLVSFVTDNEEPLLGPDELDFTGVRDRLAGLQHELFVLGFLLTSLPAPPQPASPVKPPVEKDRS